jgi:hypothetical protein
MYAEQIATALNLRRTGQRWRGQCPICKSKTGLSVTENNNAKPLIRCWACNDSPALIDLFKARGLWPKASPERRRAGRAKAIQAQGAAAVLRARTVLLMAAADRKLGRILSPADLATERAARAVLFNSARPPKPPARGEHPHDPRPPTDADIAELRAQLSANGVAVPDRPASADDLFLQEFSRAIEHEIAAAGVSSDER